MSPKTAERSILPTTDSRKSRIQQGPIHKWERVRFDIPNTRTSISHPLLIADVTVGDELESIGITICPGKKDPTSPDGA